ncbi:phospholipid-binding protein, PBP family [Syntrophus gentianae]|uniref:Phospholipid-binding protein, PBP family n=1 Tax=Syntrophus gentianae TaxID=43775 RepID=A0A1H7Z0P6_9BACT|nr:YbhB/YbcL family Raf kinase inhibitor-like protein [Syntrophus gentianae]SEM51741.1 phospholipid-binding protein, PBP family [Syntrophus gentianae]
MKGRASWIVLGGMVLLCLGFYGHALSAPKGGITMKIFCSAFKEGQKIPSKYTCDGQDVSPPLEWESVPDRTESFSLICDDPDAPGGIWVHWVIYDIPSDMKKLEENVRPERELESGIRQGKNDWSRIGYGGPCPPGGTHRYCFKLYALDAKLNLKPGATKDQLLQAMKGHVLAETQLMGKYSRQR